MIKYRLVSEPQADLDIEANLSLVREPYAVYFAVEGAVIVVLAVLYVSRDRAEWQRRRG